MANTHALDAERSSERSNARHAERPTECTIMDEDPRKYVLEEPVA